MTIAVAILVSVLLSPVSPEGAKQAAKEVVASPGYQRTLPERKPIPPEKPAKAPAGLGTAVKILFWCGIGVVGALAIVALAKSWQARSRNGSTIHFPLLDLSPALEAPLADAEALAMAGKHAEAIHVLLLKTLRALSAASSPAIAISLTSREILARVSLAADAREALGVLVEVVEVSHFGSAVPGEADWRRSVSAFKAFLAAEARARGAGAVAA